MEEKWINALLECAEGLYVIEEKTKQIVYVNSFMARGKDIQSLIGKKCYEVIYNKQQPCTYCPRLTENGEIHRWEAYNHEEKCWFNIKNKLIDVDGVLYRVGNINEVQDIMNLVKDSIGEIASLQEVLHRHEQKNEELVWETDYDRMTCLYNRSKFMRDSEEYYPNICSLAVLFFDINNLKCVNDTMGHDIGDELIKKVGRVLLSRTRPEGSPDVKSTDDTIRIYRLGGDEFITILIEAGYEDAINFINQFQLDLDEENRLGGPHCEVAVGIGSGKNKGIAQLLNEADAKMYENKKAGKAIPS